MAGPTVLTQRRAQRARFIAGDPVEVVIARTTKHRGPGRAQAPATEQLDAQTARLAQRRGSDRTPMDETRQPGVSTPSYRYYLKMRHDADVKAGTSLLDEFDLNGAHYEVAEVVDETAAAGIYGRTAVLRRVTNG